MSHWARGTLALLGLLAAGGCKTKDPTALVIAISSEAPPPKEIDSLEIEVSRDNSVTFYQLYPLGQESDAARLPGTLTLQNDTSHDPSSPVTITVRAQQQGQDRVVRRAILGFVDEKTKLLRLPLRYSCVDFPDACNDGESCVGGRCVDAHTLASALPDFSNELVFGKGQPEGGNPDDPGSCFDDGAGACLAGAQSVNVSAMSDGPNCEIAAPAGGAAGKLNFAVHWALSDDPSRVVVLEQDAEEGWVYADAAKSRVDFAPGICDAIRASRITAVVYSTACSTKSAAQEVCSSESGGNAGGCLADGGTCSSPPDDAQAPDSAATVDAGAADASAVADGGASAEAEAGTPPIADPAPAYNTPGEYGCTGCPDTGETVYELDLGAVTSYIFDGTVTGANGDGQFYVVKSLAPSDDGGAAADASALDAGSPPTERIAGPIPTSADGSYAFTAPLFCGDQLVKLVWTNASGTYALVYHVVTTQCVDADIRATLTWDALGKDWELHLIRPGGHINDPINDCTWNTCIGSPPDWGVLGDTSDNPKKDVDNTGAYGPENILLSKPENGRYTVMVEHWGDGDPASSGQVILNVKGQVTTVAIHGLAPQHVWTAATIDWNDGSAVVTPYSSIYDCTTSWSGGCQAPIPSWPDE